MAIRFDKFTEKAQEALLTAQELVCSYLAREGYDPDFGARPLRRLIQREIENRLAKMVLSGELHADQIAVVDYSDGGLRINVKEIVPATTSSE